MGLLELGSENGEAKDLTGFTAPAVVDPFATSVGGLVMPEAPADSPGLPTFSFDLPGDEAVRVAEVTPADEAAVQAIEFVGGEAATTILPGLTDGSGLDLRSLTRAAANALPKRS